MRNFFKAAYRAATDSPREFVEAGRIRHDAGYSLDWDFGRNHSPLFQISSDQDDVTVSIGGPLFYVAIGLPAIGWLHRMVSKASYPKDHNDYEPIDVIRITVHNGAMWWNLFHLAHAWNHSDPWWSEFCFHPVDRLLGRRTLKREKLRERVVEIMMPERVYRWLVSIERVTASRKRWPFSWGRPMIAFNAVPFGDDDSIPVPGKGENSWDCGPDSISGVSGLGDVFSAIGAIHERVSRLRIERAGTMEWEDGGASPERERQLACDAAQHAGG